MDAMEIIALVNESANLYNMLLKQREGWYYDGKLWHWIQLADGRFFYQTGEDARLMRCRSDWLTDFVLYRLIAVVREDRHFDILSVPLNMWRADYACGE